MLSAVAKRPENLLERVWSLASRSADLIVQVTDWPGGEGFYQILMSQLSESNRASGDLRRNRGSSDSRWGAARETKGIDEDGTKATFARSRDAKPTIRPPLDDYGGQALSRDLQEPRTIPIGLGSRAMIRAGNRLPDSCRIFSIWSMAFCQLRWYCHR